MSKRGRPKHRCRHYNRPKLRYETHIEAERAAELMAEKYQQTFAHFRCEHCRQWHVGRMADAEHPDT